MTTATRRIEFDYGHRVLGHGGKCRHLHGHRGVAEVAVDAAALDRLGMVVDFAAVKERVGGWVDASWDHALLLHRDDPQLPHLRETEERPPYVMKYGNPTAENMARELAEVAAGLLPPGLRLARVRLYETPNCWADYVPAAAAGEV